MQGYYRTGVIGVEPVIGAFPNGPMSIAKRTPEAKQDFFREPAVQDEDGFDGIKVRTDGRPIRLLKV